LGGPELMIKGRGQIDFGKETIDMLVNLEKKGLLLNSRKPITIRGKLADPELRLTSLNQSILKMGGYICPSHHHSF
jgi:hypothetical protein